jgi:hypothetical protein
MPVSTNTTKAYRASSPSMKDQLSGNTLLRAVRASFAAPSRESIQRAIRCVYSRSGPRRFRGAGAWSLTGGACSLIRGACSLIFSAPGPRTRGRPGRRSRRWR